MLDIEIKNLNVYYDNLCALEDINLSIESGQFLGIVGSNGGGKTTLLKVILGLIKPQSGFVHINSDCQIGYVPQFTSFDRLFPISVIDVILMGKLPKKFNFFYKYSENDIEQAKIIMEKLQILDLIGRQIGELSGGQMQKVLIARALINNPRILLLDEPTANIDSNTKIEIYHILKELNTNMTILIVSHDIEEMISYVDSIACLNKTLHYHVINNKIDKESFNRKYTCPVSLYINEGCRHDNCTCCGGEQYV